MQHIINNVTILYPRLNQPYHWDSTGGKEGKGQTVPCKWDTPEAKYETRFIMEKDEASKLAKLCQQAYKNAIEDSRNRNWPKEIMAYPSATVKEGDKFYQGISEAELQGWTRLRAQFGGEKTKLPKQVDAKRNTFPDDFQLTSGSKANIAVTIYPYSGGNGSGVALRFRAVQVTHLATPEEWAAMTNREVQSPFDVVDGYTTDDTFVSAPAPVEDLLEDDEIPF